MKKQISLLIGLSLLAVFLLATLFPQVFTSYSPKEMFGQWLSPSIAHLLGTNALGYDIWTEMVYGTGQTLLAGLLSSILALLLGSGIGVLSARNGFFASAANGSINIFAMLPRLVTMIVLSAFLGHVTQNLVFLIAAFSWAGTARNVRARVIHLQAQPFIENCRIQGFDPAHIVIHHVFPNLTDVLLSQFLLGVNSCILMESTLSFLGLGDLYHPTWGTMISFAYKRGAFMRHAYAYLLAPGIAIMLLSLSFYLISIYFENRKTVIRDIEEGEESL